jgi:hypothetical protein
VLCQEAGATKTSVSVLQSLAVQPPLGAEQLDELDWLAAEREARLVRAIGKVIPSRQAN